MTKIIQFEQYQQKWRAAPPLVFVDMLEDQLDFEDGFGQREIEPVLSRCRMLLAEARERHWPVAFVRPANVQALKPARWIEGFEPKRSDMVFDRLGHSCYSSDEFADAMDAMGRVFVIAGFSVESACLATVMDAQQHNQFAGLVSDATATRPLPDKDAIESHRAVTTVASRFGTIVTAEHWIGVTTGAAPSAPQRSNVSRLR